MKLDKRKKYHIINNNLYTINKKLPCPIIVLDEKGEPVSAVLFKSIPEFFNKEKNGLKPNTVRKKYFGIDRDYYDEERFDKINKFKSGEISLLFIGIKNSETDEIFLRKVKDVSIWDILYIISWNHE